MVERDDDSKKSHLALRDVMPIIVNLDVMLARRKMRSKELAERIGISEQNVSLLKSGKVKGMRFDTLAKICAVLNCQPGDILEYRPPDDELADMIHDAVEDLGRRRRRPA
jgi:putative transcriptional regulator